jgi:hypothetical protein
MGNLHFGRQRFTEKWGTSPVSPVYQRLLIRSTKKLGNVPSVPSFSETFLTLICHNSLQRIRNRFPKLQDMRGETHTLRTYLKDGSAAALAHRSASAVQRRAGKIASLVKTYFDWIVPIGRTLEVIDDGKVPFFSLWV